MNIKSIVNLITVIILFIVIFLTIDYSWFQFSSICKVNPSISCTNGFYSGIIGSILAGIIAAILAWVAWEQWSMINKTSSADFCHKLTKDFFTTETRTLFTLIGCKALIYKEPHCIPNTEKPYFGIKMTQGYFEVNNFALNKSQLPIDIIDEINKKPHYSEWEIADYILNPLEDLGTLELKGIISFNMVYSGFSYYLQNLWECDAIRRYVRVERSDDNLNYFHKVSYSYSHYLAQKCTEYDELSSRWQRCGWNIKRQLFKIKPNLDLELKDY